MNASDPLQNLSRQELSLSEQDTQNHRDGKRRHIKQENAGKVFLAVIVLLIFISSALLLFTFRNDLNLDLNFFGSSSTAEANGLDEQAVDTRSLEVSVRKPERTVLNPFTEVTVVTNKPVLEPEHNRLQWIELGQEGDSYYHIARIINLPLDDTQVTLNLSDSAGNEYTEVLKITRENFVMPVGFDSISSWEDTEYILDAANYTGRVTKQNRLLEDYEPADIVDLNETFGIFTLNDASLTAKAARALDNMLRDMREATGKNVTVASGYRSFNTQLQTYAGWVRSVGEKRANEISARPGHSEHQLGTTVDFVSEETDWQIEEAFAETEQGKWLSANAADYGFRQFLDDNQDDYAPESWQYRWIGDEDS